jgi:hypothetical protein
MVRLGTVLCLRILRATAERLEMVIAEARKNGGYVCGRSVGRRPKKSDVIRALLNTALFGCPDTACGSIAGACVGKPVPKDFAAIATPAPRRRRPARS